MRKTRLPAACLLAAALITPLLARSTSLSSATTAGVIAHMDARNPSLHSYKTRMHVQIRMTSFPFLSPHLDGTAYYKRPGNYEIVFDRVPAYAKGLKNFFSDMADSSGWLADWNISDRGVQKVNGRNLIALDMTKKIRSDQIKDTVAYVDPSSFEVVRMEWHYFNGGNIVMTQAYRTDNGFSVVSSQHADIHIPHVSAVADSGFDKYQTNVPVSDSVFKKSGK